MHALPIVVATLIAMAPAASVEPDRSGLEIDWQVVSRRAHDPQAFTQGLQLDRRGRLFESTGQYGESSLREVEPASGDVLRRLELPADWFGEGLAVVGDDLVQLTWRAGIATRRDADTFEHLDTYLYDGEGWGLCFDGERLVMSDGSDQLTFRDPATFDAIGSIEVTLDGEPLRRLNELECVDGAVWANVWLSDSLVRIDPGSGRVTGTLDLSGIIEPHPRTIDADAVLNGIAWDAAAGTFLVTGKRWPELIEIRLLEVEG
jgi:glutaminyl-peptide cyclotransferase